MELVRSIWDAFNWSFQDKSRKDSSLKGRSEVIVKNEKYLLLLLNALDTKKFSGAVKLVKAIFMAQSEAQGSHDNFTYKFYRWDYGPFDSEIYKDVERLRSSGYVNVSVDSLQPYPEKTYELTTKGQQVASKIAAETNKEFQQILAKWANRISGMTRNQVIELVYNASNVKAYEMGDPLPLPKNLR